MSVAAELLGPSLKQHLCVVSQPLKSRHSFILFSAFGSHQAAIRHLLGVWSNHWLDCRKTPLCWQLLEAAGLGFSSLLAATPSSHRPPAIPYPRGFSTWVLVEVGFFGQEGESLVCLPANRVRERNPTGFHVMGVTFHHLSHIPGLEASHRSLPMLLGRVGKPRGRAPRGQSPEVL